MALSGLAGSGGFLSAGDVKRYDDALQQAIQGGGPLPGISDFQNQDPLWNFDGSSVPPTPQPTPTPIQPSYSNTPSYSVKSVSPTSTTPQPRIGNEVYVNGTLQTSGGGFAPDGSYSAGYRTGGGPAKGGGGPFGTGPNMGPMVNGTIQTGGGGFTPEGYYSTGYHGSGEHPEITGESTPGIYKSGSFGSVTKPDLSNSAKVGDFLNYVGQMGYDISKVDKNDLVQQYHKSGGNFDGVGYLRTLPQANQNKTDLLSQIVGNPMMATAAMYQLLGGRGFGSLFAQNPMLSSAQPATQAQAVPTLSTPRIGGAQPQEEQANPLGMYNFQLLSSGAAPSSYYDDPLRKKKEEEVTKFIT